MEPSVLLKRREKARQGTVKVGEYTFTFRRPTEYRMFQLYEEGLNAVDLCDECVIDWSDNVTESVLIPGGGSDKVPFDKALWRDWCADSPEFWDPIAKAIKALYVSHTGEVEEAGNA